MKHHYIPQFYLRPWLGRDDKLQEFRRGYKGRLQTGRYGTDVTGFEHDLYAMPEVSPEERHRIERVFMGMVDNRATEVRNRLLEGNVPQDPELRQAWATFLLSLRMRNPEAVAQLKRRFISDWGRLDEVMEALYQGVENIPWSIAEYLRTRSAVAAERQALTFLTDIVDSSLVLRFVPSMAWDVIDLSSASRTLMTSDRPLMMSNGLNSPEGHLALAISPTKLFVACTASRKRLEFARMPVSQLVRSANDSVVGQGRKYVYALDKTPFGYVEKQMGTRDYLQVLPERPSRAA